MLALLGFCPAPALPQVRVLGRVIADESGTPLANVMVVLRTPAGSYVGKTETDAAGMFDVTVKVSSGITLRAVRRGYQPTTTPTLYFDGRSFFGVEIRMAPDVVLLAPLEVVARSDVDRSHFLDAFRHRLRTGFGRYITRAEIESRNPVYVSDLLRSIPGIDLAADASGHRAVVQSRRAGGMTCTTRVFVDGFMANPPVATASGPRSDIFRLDDVVSPHSVEGIEIYTGTATIPPEFLTTDAPCGVIAIWTRRGGS